MPLTYNTQQVLSWDELLESINNGASHPYETQWAIYRYLKENYKNEGSVMSRTLLAAYMKLHVNEPSLINSLMLGIAAKVSEVYPDFRFPQFLKAWGYKGNLRNQDKERQTSKDGRTYLALVERVERALQSYLLHHPEEEREDCNLIVSMYAVKVFEKISDGKKRRYVKLVAANGSEFIADSHQFPCKPWEICGRLFDVLTRVSRQGKERASEIVVSKKRVDEVFSTQVGYVDGIDESHNHVHIYNAQSQHFVAEKSTLSTQPSIQNISNGSFVLFCPIIANGDHFKSAAIIRILNKDEGRKAFGMYEAVITFVNRQEQFIRYAITQDIRSTNEGTISKEGFASTAAISDEDKQKIAVGKHVWLLLFLKRGKEGTKRNHVAEIMTDR
ncbi:hypothetical protein [Prevotella sp.]|uniref:hypothetical protein n=1 Tax=Prevotella sp. TaxID=59823 RepID=UPI002E793825|nr:hypothetical protein [Prevotella sp.]MEE0670995.1 hypothetical protein [Prevotella sp.]